MTSVQTKKSGRIVSVIPKGEALNARLEHGDELSWHIRSRDRVRVSVEDEDTPRPTTQVRYDEHAGSYSVTIPAAIAYGMHAVDGTVEWDYDRGNLIMEIVSRGGSDD